jgi:hypothetical protein
MNARKDAADGGRPPAPPAVRRRYSVGCQAPGNLAEAPAPGALLLNPFDDLSGNRGTPPWATPRRELNRRDLGVLFQEPLEFANGNQSCPPRCLYRVQGRDDAAVESRNADAESLGRLPAGVDETFGAVSEAEILGLSPGALRSRGTDSPAALLRPSALTSRGHVFVSVHEY